MADFVKLNGYNVKDITSRENNLINSKYINNRFNKNTLLFTHGSGYLEAPANTIPAWNIAIEQMFDGIEVDVMISNDDVFYCSHYEELSDFTNGSGLIPNVSSTYIDSLVITQGNYIADYTNLSIPKLSTFLQIIKRNNKYGLIDLKGAYTNSQLQALYTLIESYGAEPNVIISSNDSTVLQQIHIDRPLYRILWIAEATIENIDYAYNNGFTGLNVEYGKLYENDKYIESKGLKLFVWRPLTTANTSAILLKNVDGLLLDNLYMYNSISPDKDFTAEDYTAYYTLGNGLQARSKYDYEQLSNAKILDETTVKMFLGHPSNRAVASSSYTNPFNRLNHTNPTQVLFMDALKIKPSSSIVMPTSTLYRYAFRSYNKIRNDFNDTGWKYSGETITNFQNADFGYFLASKQDNQGLTYTDCKKILAELKASIQVTY